MSKYYEFDIDACYINGKDGRKLDADISTSSGHAITDELNRLRLIAERLAIYTSQLHIAMDYMAKRWNNVQGFDILANAAKFRVDFVDVVLTENNWDKQNMEESLQVCKELLTKKETPKVNIIGLNGTKE